MISKTGDDVRGSGGGDGTEMVLVLVSVCSLYTVITLSSCLCYTVIADLLLTPIT